MSAGGYRREGVILHMPLTRGYGATAAFSVTAGMNRLQPSAQVVDNDGTYRQASTGFIRSAHLNQARIERSGYLSEGDRENVGLESQTFDAASWNKFNGMSVTANSNISPDGNTNADTIADTSASQLSIIRDTFSIVPAGADITISVWVLKQGVTNIFPAQVFALSGGTGIGPAVNLDTRTGDTSIRNDVGSVVTFAELDGDFYRWITTFTDNDTGNNQIRNTINPATAATLGGVSDNSLTGSQIYYGYQTEVGSFASSYIPNTTLATTRSADSLAYL